MQGFEKTTLLSICHLHYSVITPTFSIMFCIQYTGNTTEADFFITLNVLLNKYVHYMCSTSNCIKIAIRQ